MFLICNTQVNPERRGCTTTCRHAFCTILSVRSFTAHSASGAIQLFPLSSQLFDYAAANLLRLIGDTLASFDALAGIIQRLSALQKQSSLGLLIRLNGADGKTLLQRIEMQNASFIILHTTSDVR